MEVHGRHARPHGISRKGITMATKSIEEIESVTQFTDKDKILIQKDLDKFIITEKLPVFDLEAFYVQKTVIDSLKKIISDLNVEIHNIPVPYITKDDFQNATSKESLNGLKESLLTDAMLKSKLSEYAKTDNVEEAEKAWKEAWEKHKDEMTDFTAAALVGLAQSAAMMGGMEAGEEEKKE